MKMTLVPGIFVAVLGGIGVFGSRAEAAKPEGPLASYSGDKLPNRGETWIRLGGTEGDPVAAGGILTLQSAAGARSTVVYEKHHVFTRLGTPYRVDALVRLQPESAVTSGIHQFAAFSADASYEGSFVNARIIVDGAEVAGSVRIDYQVGTRLSGQFREFQPASWANGFHTVELRFDGTTQSIWVDGVEKVSDAQLVLDGRRENRMRWSLDTLTNDGTGRVQLDSLTASEP